MYQQLHINMEQALKTDIDVKTIYHLIPSLVLSRGPPMNCHSMMGSDINVIMSIIMLDAKHQ